MFNIDRFILYFFSYKMISNIPLISLIDLILGIIIGFFEVLIAPLLSQYPNTM